MVQPTRKRFAIGRIVATPGARAALERSGQDALVFLVRHSRCDWGEIDQEDWKLNDEAVAHEGDLDRQGRVLSAYMTSAGERLWVITEADRSSTCLLLPSEY